MRISQRQTGMILLFGSLIWMAGDRVSGFSFFQFNGVNVTWPTKQSVRSLSPSTFPAGSTTDTLILSAMSLWNVVPAADFQYSFTRPTQDFPLDHFDGFNDTLAVPAASLDPGVLAATFQVNNGADWFDTDIVFSDLPLGVGYSFDVNPDCATITTPTPTNGFSFLLVATHELGHALGLGHDPIGNEPPGTAWFAAMMNPIYPNGGPIGQGNIIKLHTDDQRGVRFLYPHSGPSAPPVIDLACAGYTTGPTLGKVIPLPFTPAAVFPADVINVRSVIENAGTTNEFFVRQGFYLSTDALIDTSDLLLGTLRWDIAFEDAIDFSVDVNMPTDIAAGTYFLGSILDDLNEVAETFEGNNDILYCNALIINQSAPIIDNLLQQVAICGQPFTGPTPTVALPLNMAPITWSLDNPQPGMIIDPMTGIISWPDPIPSPFQLQIFIRATNTAGSATQSLLIGVSPALPSIVPISGQVVACPAVQAYTGPTPQLTDPPCMDPILNWFLAAGPSGMTINGGSGVVSWLNPIPSTVPYTISIGATNAIGNGTTTWQLLVSEGDVNGNAMLDLADAGAFANVLAGTDTDPQRITRSDINCDGTIDANDIQPFVTTMLSGL